MQNISMLASPNYPPLAVSGVHLKINSGVGLSISKTKKLLVNKELDDNVVIVKMFPD